MKQSTISTPPHSDNRNYEKSAIPKVIHYCWFGDKKLDRFARNCIKTWRKHLPGYKIKCWTNDSIRGVDNPFIKKAIADKRWAFVSDYIRLYALYHEGGIYFDTDVKLYSDISKLMDCQVLIPTQASPTTGHNLMSAVIAAVPNHPYLKKCLEYYSDLEYDPNNYRKVIINPIMSRILHDGWGYKYENQSQELIDNIRILDRTYFESDYDITDKKHSDFYGVHFCNQSWVSAKRGRFYTFCKSNDLMGLYKMVSKCASVLK